VDELIVLGKPHKPLSKGQESMRRGIETILAGLELPPGTRVTRR
jgi:hypothetical protein